jgi:hypothetical protein
MTSERSRKELMEMIQQIGKTRNLDKCNKLIDRFNGDEAKEETSTDKLSK